MDNMVNIKDITNIDKFVAETPSILLSTIFIVIAVEQVSIITKRIFAFVKDILFTLNIAFGSDFASISKGNPKIETTIKNKIMLFTDVNSNPNIVIIEPPNIAITETITIIIAATKPYPNIDVIYFFKFPFKFESPYALYFSCL